MSTSSFLRRMILLAALGFFSLLRSGAAWAEAAADDSKLPLFQGETKTIGHIFRGESTILFSYDDKEERLYWVEAKGQQNFLHAYDVKAGKPLWSVDLDIANGQSVAEQFDFAAALLRVDDTLLFFWFGRKGTSADAITLLKRSLMAGAFSASDGHYRWTTPVMQFFPDYPSGHTPFRTAVDAGTLYLRVFNAFVALDLQTGSVIHHQDLPSAANTWQLITGEQNEKAHHELIFRTGYRSSSGIDVDTYATTIHSGPPLSWCPSVGPDHLDQQAFIGIFSGKKNYFSWKAYPFSKERTLYLCDIGTATIPTAIPLTIMTADPGGLPIPRSSWMFGWDKTTGSLLWQRQFPYRPEDNLLRWPEELILKRQNIMAPRFDKPYSDEFLELDAQNGQALARLTFGPGVIRFVDLSETTKAVMRCGGGLEIWNTTSRKPFMPLSAADQVKNLINFDKTCHDSELLSTNLMRIGKPAKQPLYRIIMADDNEDAPHAAISAYIDLAEKSDFSDLWKLYRSLDYPGALFKLLELGDNRALQEVRRRLKENEGWDERMGIFMGLAKVRTPEALTFYDSLRPNYALNESQWEAFIYEEPRDGEAPNAKQKSKIVLTDEEKGILTHAVEFCAMDYPKAETPNQSDALRDESVDINSDVCDYIKDERNQKVTSCHYKNIRGIGYLNKEETDVVVGIYLGSPGYHLVRMNKVNGKWYVIWERTLWIS